MPVFKPKVKRIRKYYSILEVKLGNFHSVKQQENDSLELRFTETYIIVYGNLA